MSDFSERLVMITPVAHLDLMNTLADRFGWGAPAFSAPLSASGAPPPMHYGLHTWVQPEFLPVIVDLRRGILPAGLDTSGLNQADIDAALRDLIIAVNTPWAEVMTEHGLRIVDTTEG